MKAHTMRRKVREGGLAHRLLTIATDNHHWYDWGHRLMTLVGRWDGTGDYSMPRGRDLWYRFDSDNETSGKIITTHRYTDVRDMPDAGWKVFDVQDDGHTVMLGWWGDRIRFYGLNRRELALFRRWDLWERRARGEWFGIRRWLYCKGLHAAVHLRKPFACNTTPPPGSGGYSHWHCELRGKHTEHRFRAYVWVDGRVTHRPNEQKPTR
jgi:hypothetical protein